MDYVIAFIIGGKVLNLHINPMGTMPRHVRALDFVERGTDEWDNN